MKIIMHPDGFLILSPEGGVELRILTAAYKELSGLAEMHDLASPALRDEIYDCIIDTLGGLLDQSLPAFPIDGPLEYCPCPKPN